MISWKAIVVVAVLLLVLWMATDAPKRAAYAAAVGGAGIPLHPTEYHGSAFAPASI